ncbi:FG-GAP and VCBS repeat-containing protein [Actinomadura sp. B10D3]|uniref:FG-GAP and VCBS repeat-containing protein n=1 Tax=Actinomadura sp. B10D3 TaxID=3153557 RepID=UPI00325F5E68
MPRRNWGLRGAALTAAVVTGTAGLAPLPAQAAPRVPAPPGDFNGDGHRDLALGSPSSTANGAGFAGFVTVVYGSASGPDTAKRQVISQESAGIPGASEEWDQFGDSLASADFDLDGYADLAVVASGEDSGGAPLEGGRITLVYGSASGLSSRAVAFGSDDGGALTVSAGDVDHDGRPDLIAGGRGSFTVYGGLASGDVTGKTTAVGSGEGETVRVSTSTADLTGDGYADLAVAFNWWPIDGDDRWLRLDVYQGSASGLAGAPAFTTSDLRVRSLAAGDVNGDGRADLVAGVESSAGGEIRVFPGTASGIGSATVIDQDTDGVPGTEEREDDFGDSVAVGDVNGDGKADIAVGAPEETVGTASHAGAATVLYGGPDGVTGAGAQQFGQNSAGVPGTAEQNDRFGSQVSLADLDGDGKADLTAGSSGEDGGDGALVLLDGGASGVTTEGSRAIGAGTLGVQGRSARIGGVVLP